MTSPGWMRWLLARLAPPGGAEDVLGDLEEAYRARVARHGRGQALLLTAVEALEMAAALIGERLRRRHGIGRSPGAEPGSAEHGRRRASFSWIDVKLGFRLLVRYPGLTLVGGAAMAFAIAVGAGAFEAVKQLVDPRLPLEGGDRIVAVRQWDAARGNVHGEALHDFFAWREELESIEDLGAFRSVERNLTVAGGGTEPVYVAEISASAFRVTRVSPLLGRFLVDADEQAGASPVVVIGYDVWRTRFASDPEVVGRTVRLGRVEATVVGVMAEGFAFPVAHELWAPLQLNPLHYERGEGPAIAMFGRLADGAALEQAQAELTAIGARTAASFPATYEHLRPEVLPFAKSIVMLDVPPRFRPLFYAANVFFVMLLVLICANVALLMFARAATRESEIVVRTALGASRWRIITQLFTEALVLGSLAALAGIAAAHLALEAWLAVSMIEHAGRLPFWFHDRLEPATVLYAVALTVLGAAIAGIVPALKMTGRGVEAHLRQLAGGGGLRFGSVWTAVIVTQVAVTVAFPATAFFARQYVVGLQSLDVGFDDDEYLSLRLELDRESGARGAADMSPAELSERFDQTYRQFAERLTTEPGITGITFTDRLPRTHHPVRAVEIHDPAATDAQISAARPVSTAAVGVEFFDVLETPVLAGRGFRSADLAADARVVIVNESFVDHMLEDRNAIGRLVRYAAPGQEPGPWHEIIGVVPDIGVLSDRSRGAGMYHPATPKTAYPFHLALHVRGDPQSLEPRLRSIAAAIDPGLRIHDVMPMSDVGATMWMETDFIYRLLVAISAVALLLSLAGIYAVMSFTVSRRTREIGVRVALGATTREVTTAIFSRPLRQVGYGILAGSVLTAALALGIARGVSIEGVVLVIAYAALMMGVCMLACIVPTRRALRIEPSQALRTEA